MIRPAPRRRLPGRRSVSYLIAVGAMSTIGAAPLLSAGPALAQNIVNVSLTVQVGQAAHLTLPGSGSYNVYNWPACGKASWAGTAYTFDTMDTSNGRPVCTPQSTSNSLLDNSSGDRINVNITVNPVVTAPAAPASVDATPGDGSLTLNWSAVPDADAYEYSLDAGTTWSSDIAGTSTTVTGLVNGTAYSVAVRALTSGVAGAPSNSITATPVPPLALPTAPGDLAVQSPGTGELSISWTAADSAEQVDGYEYSLDGGTTWTAGTSPTSLSGLADGTYDVGVRAHNASGYGPASSYVPIALLPVVTPPAPPSTPTTTPPAAPGRPTVTAGDRSISISWPAVTGATGYEYSVDGGHTWSAPTTHRSVTVSGLQDGRAYSVRVRALTGSVAGAASAAVSVTPHQPVAAQPAQPALPSLQRQGSRGSDVVRIQRLLGIPADGIYGPQTAAAVRAFQAAHHLQVDGIVGRQTWTALLAGGGTGRTETTRPWLRLGSTGSYVREVQRDLGVAVDGIFGNRTRAAVVSFQARHHLQIDGIVGTQTWAALMAG